MLTVVGNTLGAFTAAVLVAFGLGAVVASSALVYTVLKLVGAAYLVFLGVQAIRHRRAHVAAGGGADTGPRTWVALRQGYIVGVTNPKGAVFLVAAMPQFVDPDRGTVWLQGIVLGAVFALIALLSDTVWVLVAGTARAWFARSPRRLAGVNAGGGGLMIGLGVKVAVSGRAD